MMMKKVLLTGALLLSGAAALVFVLQPEEQAADSVKPSPEKAEVHNTEKTNSSALNRGDNGLSREQWQQWQRKFLASRIESQSEDEIAKEQDDELEDSADSLFEQATEKGEWTERDAISLMGLQEKMTPEQLNAAMKRVQIIVAKNSLRNETP